MTTYKFSRRIGRGGMAEVFLALQEGLGGFEKLVVVKRIFPHFCEDAHFVQMFFDEARLAASVRHPNVVEILDVCRDERGLFIVMEYLSGETVSYMNEQMRTEGDGRFPFSIACRICADTAAGLDSAHTATDEKGKPRAIVHRDVTPSNLLVGYSGVVKVLDFGVAKAAVDRGETDPGTLKGKIGYLAPELLRGESVDARADVFQLGVVLHEMITGRTLFKAENDHKTMTAVLEREIPAPSALEPGLPPELDRIVMSAVDRDVKRRTQSADKLRRELEAVLRAHGNVTQNDVGDWLKMTFTSRYEERVALERECVQEMKRARAPSEVPAMTAPFAPTAPFSRITGETAVTVLEIPSRPGVTRNTRRRRRRRARTAWMIGAGAATVALVIYAAGRGGGAVADEPPGADETAVAEPAPEDAPPPDGLDADAKAETGAESTVGDAIERGEETVPGPKTAPTAARQNSGRPARSSAKQATPAMPAEAEPTPVTTETETETDTAPPRGARTDNRDPWAEE